MKVLGYKINSEYLAFPIAGKMVINTINPHSYCVAKKDVAFREALKASDLLIPDGTGITWAVQLLKHKKISRITGYDINHYLLQKAQQNKLRVFYMGASKKTLAKIRRRIGHEYPDVICDSYSPPYKAEFSERDSKKMIDKVNAFNPDILFIGMTAPKQEKWVYRNKAYLNANVICSIGAVFDFYAETVERPSPFWQRLGLEWLPRLLREPKRLWRRNFISTPVFIWDVFKAKFS